MQSWDGKIGSQDYDRKKRGKTTDRQDKDRHKRSIKTGSQDNYKQK
jgi:hypothetical protein